MVYKYLKLYETMFKISLLSKCERENLKDSAIVNEGRDFIYTIHDAEWLNCVLHADLLQRTLDKMQHLLSLTEKISIDIALSRWSCPSHNLGEAVGHFIASLPDKFSLGKVSVYNNINGNVVFDNEMLVTILSIKRPQMVLDSYGFDGSNSKSNKLTSTLSDFLFNRVRIIYLDQAQIYAYEPRFSLFAQPEHQSHLHCISFGVGNTVPTN